MTEKKPSPTTLPIGSRGRLIRDAWSDGCKFWAGTTFIVEDGPIEDEGDGAIFYWAKTGSGKTVWFLIEDVEAVATDAEVAAEPKPYLVSATVTVEVVRRILAHSTTEADATFAALGFDVIDGFADRGTPTFTNIDSAPADS